MKTKIIHTIITIFLVTLLFSNSANSQWVQTKGPGAGITPSMITVGNDMFANNLYHGKGDGRVYRSTNLGAEWFAADNGITGVQYIYDFANVGNAIFAANGSSGVYRTTDLGNTWISKNSGFQGTPLSLLSKDGLIFVGHSGIGVHVSTNLGETWLARNNGLPTGTVIVYEMEQLGNYIYAGIEGGGGPAPLYRSSNNGLLWEISNQGLPLGSNVHEFAVNGSVIFTSIEGDFGQNTYGIFRSLDSGRSWTNVNNEIPFVVGGNAGEIFTHNGVIYLSTTFSVGVRLFKSTNNGDNWIPAESGLKNQETYSFTAAGGFIFAGMGWYSSVFRTSNEGASWTASNKGLANSSTFVVYQIGPRLYAGAQEGLFFSDDQGENWTEMENGLPFGRPVVDIKHNGNNIFLGTDQYGIFRSTDNGASWSSASNGLNGIYAKYINTLLVKDNVIYAGTWGGVYKSTDNGNNWIISSNGLPGGTNFVQINFLATLNGNLFASTVLQRVYKSTNNGTSWFPSGTGISFYGSTGYDIIVKGNDLFTATEDGIYKSSNEGSSWTLMKPGISKRLVLAGNNIISSNFGATYLTGYNLLLSTDNGVSWTTYNTGMNPGSRVMSLFVSGNTLFGATDTRSVWKRDISDLLPSINVDLTLFIEGRYNESTNLQNGDTVRTYLRNASAPFNIVDSSKTYIGPNGTGTLRFFNAPGGTYYITIRHRNSIETWSKNGGETMQRGIPFSYSFASQMSQAYGNNLILKGASYCVYSGDVNQDGAVNLSDVIDTYNDGANFVTGYVVTDLNGDNTTNLTDILITQNNTVSFVNIRRP